MRLEPRVRIRAGGEQRLHHVEIRGLLLLHFLRLGITGARLPLRVHRGPERRGAVLRRSNVRIRSALEQEHRHIELAVDHGDQQRARALADAHLIDVRAAGDERGGSVDIALTRGVQQRRETALGSDRRIDLLWVETVGGGGLGGCPGFALLRRGHFARSIQLARGFDRRLHLTRRRPLAFRHRGLQNFLLQR